MNDKGFELQPLSIKGEVLNGRCLLCNPLKEGETMDNSYADTKQPASKKGGRENYNGEPFSSKNKGRRNNSFDNKDPEISFTLSDPIDPPSQGDNDQSGSNQMNMSTPTHQQQRQNMMRMVKYSPTHADKQHLPLPISGRDPSSRRPSSGSNNNKFSTSAPNHFHSKMALTMQSKLRRKHSPRQHAMLVFGNTNNQRKRDNKNKNGGRQQNQNLTRRSSTGSGIVNQQMIMMGNSNKPGPPGSSGSGMWQKERQQSSSNASLSSVSCSEIESTTQHLPNNSKHNNDNVDDNYSKGSHFSQHNMMGGLGTAMAMGMGMHCAETVSVVDQQQQQQHRPRSSDPPSHPQTPHKNNRRTPTPSRRTPQSVPANMSNHLSSRMSQTPQTVLPIMNNIMSNRIGGGSSSNQQLQPSQSNLSNITHSNDSMSMTGHVPPAVRLAHSKLPSSIYHHHLYPMNDDMERAHIEKALAYLENGSGDISDIIVAMRRFPFSLAIQRVSAEKLYAHCFDTEHAHAIGLVGGIRTIIDAMEHHPEDIALQRGCAGIIKHLAIASKYNVEMLDKMGAVGIVVGAMERHPKVAPLLESCCWALESMSRCHSQEFKMRVAKGGGIHAAMKAVEVFPNNESLLRAAFHCLRQLGYNPSSYNNQGGQQHMQKLQQFHKQHQRQHGSSSQQQQHHQKQQKKHQKQQVPSYVSHRGNGGNQHRQGSSSGGGMNMMPNNMSNNMPNNLMMGNNSSPMMMGNKINMNNSMMANMMNNNPMMANNSMMSGSSNMGNSINNSNMNSNRHM